MRLRTLSFLVVSAAILSGCGEGPTSPDPLVEVLDIPQQSVFTGGPVAYTCNLAWRSSPGWYDYFQYRFGGNGPEWDFRRADLESFRLIIRESSVGNPVVTVRCKLPRSRRAVSEALRRLLPSLTIPVPDFPAPTDWSPLKASSETEVPCLWEGSYFDWETGECVIELDEHLTTGGGSDDPSPEDPDPLPDDPYTPPPPDEDLGSGGASNPPAADAPDTGDEELLTPPDGIDPVFFEGLNDLERQMCIVSPAECFQVYLAKRAAETNSKQNAPGGALNGQEDAYRHAFWSAEMSRRIGIDRAKAWGDAHEAYSPDDQYTQMDLHNNLQGRRIWGEVSTGGYGGIGEGVEDYLCTGRLIVYGDITIC